jgi:hypothetical protein
MFCNAHFRCKLLCKHNYLHAEDDTALADWWPSCHSPPTACAGERGKHATTRERKVPRRCWCSLLGY